MTTLAQAIMLIAKLEAREEATASQKGSPVAVLVLPQPVRTAPHRRAMQRDLSVRFEGLTGGYLLLLDLGGQRTSTGR